MTPRNIHFSREIPGDLIVKALIGDGITVMKRARIYSYGMIPVHQSVNGPEVLLVEQYSAEGTHWGFPKGKTEPGEEPLATAKREAREETGITFNTVLEGAHFTVNYSFTYEDTIVDKTVTYFIGFVDNPGLALQESEIKNAGWFKFDEARERLSHLNTKEMFDSAILYIKENLK